ncbi:hypothetical protein MC47_020225 [Citrobacter freundii]|nr:hypothetical protein MC47_020225 [Citrobacter freundii]
MVFKLLYYKEINAQDVKKNDVLLQGEKQIIITSDAVQENINDEVVVNLEYNHSIDMQFNIDQKVKVVDFAYAERKKQIVKEKNKDILSNIGAFIGTGLMLICGLVFIIWLVKTIWYLV